MPEFPIIDTPHHASLTALGAGALPHGGLTTVDSAAAFDEAASDGDVLALFSASWCRTGERLGEALEELAPSLTLALLKIDVDRAPLLPRRLGVSGVPSLVLLRRGVVVAKRCGDLSAAQVRYWIEDRLGAAIDQCAMSPAANAAGHPLSAAPCEGALVDAEVKWFDPKKGFGFVVIKGLGDVFLHKAVVRSPIRELLVRQARLKVRLGNGPKGPQVVQVVTAATP